MNVFSGMSRVEGAMNRISMKSAAQLTQLSEHTLRAWEKRYGVVTPKRFTSGHRGYEPSDIEKLILLRKLVQAGESIGHICGLSTPNLKKLLQSRENAPQPQANSVKVLIDLLGKFDLESVQAHLRSLQLHFETKSFLVEIVAPFLNSVGEHVATGKLDVFHEHAVSAILRNLLSGLMYLTEQSLGPRAPVEVVISTPEGDLHEFGILIAAILVMLKGKKVLYLGPNLPAESIARACKLSGASQVLVAASCPEDWLSKKKLTDFLETLEKNSPKNVEFLIGGARAHEFKKSLVRGSRKFRIFESLHSFDSFLK